MAKIKVAIYDVDKGYRERFADYLMSYKPQEMEVSVFSQIQYFIEGLEVDKYQLLVLGCGYEEALGQVRGTKIPVLVLTEYMQSYVKETAGFEEEQILYTSKYQSMDVITRQMQVMVEKQNPKGNRTSTADLEIVGVVSPNRHEMQMFFSLLHARNLGEKEKVLYINLLELSGFAEIFGETEYDMGDAILQLREEAQAENVLSCIYRLEGISYISPLKSPESVKEITEVDIQRLLKFVTDYTDYRTVILDLSVTVTGLVEVLLQCSKIYCLTKKGYYYEMQRKQFMDYLEKLVDTAFLERLISVELPYQAKVITGGLNLLEQLDWSEFGACVRQKGGCD